MTGLPGRRVILAALGSLLLTVCSHAQLAKHVFIVSIDQGAPEDILNSEMPLLLKMAAEGAHTWEAYTIVPSLTLPSHVSMLTGVGIQKHQILWNEFEPQKGLLKVPTIFRLARDRGLVTALFAGKSKFHTLRTPRSLDFAVIPEKTTALETARLFAAEVSRLKPNLCFIHFADADTAGHKFGVHSPEKLRALAECDQALKILMDAISAAGLTESSVVIVTADHGGHDRSAEDNARRMKTFQSYQPGTHGTPQTSDVVIPWIAWGHGVKKNYSITAPVVTYDTAATALWLLGIPLPDDLWGRPVKSAFENP